MSYAPHRATLATPIGTVLIEGSIDAVTAIHILPTTPHDRPADFDPPPRSSPVARALEQLGEYFDGTRRGFDLPLQSFASPRGQALRGAIAGIGFGETRSYGALASALGSGARAVGGACRRNPYPIVIPCHRVTSSGGAPERYSAGDGPSTKAWLIAHEARIGEIPT